MSQSNSSGLPWSLIENLKIWPGLMVSALISRLRGTGLSTGRDVALCFLALYSHSACLYPGVKMGSGKLNVGGTLQLRGGGEEVEILQRGVDTPSCFKLQKLE